MGSARNERLAELRAFDETKAGVKGLVDAGITFIPSIYIHPHSPSLSPAPPEPTASITSTSILIIDLSGILEKKDQITRKDTVEKIRDAAVNWGLFQVVNHGIRDEDMKEMIEGVRRFFKQDVEVKKLYYSRDYIKSMVYNCNFDIYTGIAPNWRDSFNCRVAPDSPNPDDFPIAFRDILMIYSKQVMQLGKPLFELLSEALGLKPSYLNDVGCSKGLAVLGHYYPTCPQPEVVMGSARHTDRRFLTVLLQDRVAGLQILHKNEWIDVPPMPGAMVINIADLLQLVSNDKFRSLEHKVGANRKGPRISIASFFRNPFVAADTVYEPIKELLSETDPPRYRGITNKEYHTFNTNKGLNGVSSLHYFRL